MTLGQPNPARQFPFQRDGEEVILSTRRHWALLLARLAPPTLVEAVPVALLLAALVFYGSDPATYDRLFRYAGMTALIIAPVAVFWGLANAYDWSNDSFIVTNQRVIRIQRDYIFAERVIEAQLGQVQNVTVTVPDFFAQAFGYGTVLIETAATEGRILFDEIPNPRLFQQTIASLRGLPEDKLEEGMPTVPHNLRELLDLLLPTAVQKRPFGLIWHKHWVVLMQAITWPILALLVFLGLFAWLHWPILPALAVLTLPVLLWQYVDWWNDIYIVTEDQIIDIQRIPLIYESRREAFLAQIQDVRYNIPNFSHRVLDYGTVTVETAGKAENFEFIDVPHPSQVQAVIVERLTRHRAAKKQAEVQAMAAAAEESIRGIVLDVLQRNA